MHTPRVLIAFMAFFFVGVVSAPAQNPTVAVAPMQFRGLMPVIETKINGQGPFFFAIDTGGGMQADIDPSVVTQLNLKPTGKVIIGDPSRQNDREMELTSIASLTFGGAEFRNVTALIRPQRITKDYPEVDGFLGFALFSEYLLTLDYPAMQVRLARGALPAANGSDILPFEIENRIPVIQLGVGKLHMKAHIDSGNFVAGFILPEEVVEQLTLLSPPVTVGHARSVTNQIEIKQARIRDTIRLGSFQYPEATVAFPAPSETNVGFKVLREFAITFDQKNKRMKFVRTAAETTTASR
jgi:hypothetical protein